MKNELLNLIRSGEEINIKLAIQVNSGIKIFDFESLCKETSLKKYEYQKHIICRKFLANHKDNMNYNEFMKYMNREQLFTEHTIRLFFRCLENFYLKE